MGLWSLFGKGPMSQAKIDKVAKNASNAFAQPDVRLRDLHRLMAEGTGASIRGALKRFTVNANGHIADEDEKKWLEDALVETGEAALEPLRDYVRVQDNLTYALRAFRRIAGDPESVRYFLEVLEAYGPDDYRAAEAKLQLIWMLAEMLDDARVLPGLRVFLLDHSDDVRWAVMDLFEKAAAKGGLDPALLEATLDDFGVLVTDDSVGPRIQRRAAELLAAQEWQIRTEAAALTPLLEEDFFLDKKHYVRRRVRVRV